MATRAQITPYVPVLVPALHRIQDRFGYLKPEALREYAEEANVPQYRLQEVASFFPHFRLAPPKKVTLRVCRDMSCHLAGSGRLLEALKGVTNDEVAVEGISCLGRCDRAPAACLAVQGVEHEHYYLGRSFEELRAIIAAAVAGEAPPSNLDSELSYLGEGSLIDPYKGELSDYRVVRKAIAARNASIDAAARVLESTSGWKLEMLEQFRVATIRKMRVEDPLVRAAVLAWQTEDDWAKGPTLGGWSDTFLNEIRDADLRGLGGAGIPAVQKWRDVRDEVRQQRRRRREDDRAFIVVNGDESEPGTFKDRELLLRTPHLVVEAVILASLITEATQGFIYIRHEYGEQIEACRQEIRRAQELGLCGPNAFTLGRSLPKIRKSVV